MRAWQLAIIVPLILCAGALIAPAEISQANACQATADAYAAALRTAPYVDHSPFPEAEAAGFTFETDLARSVAAVVAEETHHPECLGQLHSKPGVNHT